MRSSLRTAIIMSIIYVLWGVAKSLALFHWFPGLMEAHPCYSLLAPVGILMAVNFLEVVIYVPVSYFIGRDPEDLEVFSYVFGSQFLAAAIVTSLISGFFIGWLLILGICFAIPLICAVDALVLMYLICHEHREAKAV